MKEQKPATSNWLDKAIATVMPGLALKRATQRRQLDILNFNYDGSVGSRLSESWPLTQYTPQYRFINYQEQMRMRDRSRNLERNNAIADGLLTRSVENVIGPNGLTLQAKTQDPEWNKRAEAFWEETVESIDVTGLTWVEHQELALRSHLRDGDMGTILLKSGQIQPVEGDLICDPYGIGSVKNSIVNGVEITGQARPIRFYIATYDEAGKQGSKPYDAKDFVFFPRVKRFGQVRGEPCFAQSFNLFDQIDKWVEAVLVAARMAACSGIAITKNEAGKFGRNLRTTHNNDGKKQREISMEPGMVPILEPGEEITQLNPAQPGMNFPESLTMMMRLTGLTLGMPLEMVLLDFSRGSYATVRAALLQCYAAWLSLRNRFSRRYLGRIYRWRISKAINDGILAPREDAWRHRFNGKPWPYLDPLKELTAIQLGIDIGVDNLTTALQTAGHDLTGMLTTRETELKQMRERKIPIYHAQQLLLNDENPTPGNTDSDDDE